MNWKTVFSVIIIFAIVALILFSPKGQKYHGNYTSKYTKPLGSFITGLTSKVTKSSSSGNTGDLEVELKNVEISDLRDIEVDVESDVTCSMRYEVINFLGTEVDVESDVANMEMGNLNGKATFYNNGKTKIEGTTDLLKINL